LSSISKSWSRRRAAVAAEAAAEEAAAQEAELLAEQAALAEKSDAEILEELGLPDPDTLIMGDDFKVFLGKAVPAHLRKRALRVLWRSNPVLACVDGLNDYDDDYLTGSTGQGVIKTSYQVGKGMLDHLLEVERQKNNVETDVMADAPDVDDETVPGPETVEARSVPTPEAADQERAHAARPRRMQFQFEDRTV